MVTRAPMLGFLVALTALAGALDARPARAQPAPSADVRVVTVRAVADEMYRAQPGWQAMLRRTIQTVSDIYERNFQIRLAVHDVVPWTIGPAVPVPRILGRVRAEVSTGPAAYLRLAEALDRSGRPAEAWSAAEQAHDRGEDVAPAFWQQLTEKLPSAPPLPPPCAEAVAGAGVDLDNPEPALRGYIARVRERVRAHMVYPRGAGERAIAGELRVEFRIGREGRIECVALSRSSGSELLDRYVLSALRLAQPFAALPAHVPPPSLPVSGTFRFRISEGAASR